ncbi:ribosome maturation factor RimM [Saliterribacillus persicus]|uniref:Ribosome maturation factor RimM n=1 Tax=Saliterribacillus persicus TaxID=930114 RepID=A0A368XTC5_9BACI|nr:ribosome maturation factor RimM [Saliterribacillus persicus]RCW70739.1 16S rRNA processing protein RimM [Saliterribacillus persicus]
MQEYLNVGKIVNTHGIKGEVKIVRITDFDERFELNQQLFIEDEAKKMIPVEIDGHRTHKQFELLHFKGYDNINDVEKFKGALLKVDKKQLEPLENGEFYYHEIIDCDVYTLEGEFLGKVTEILAPGANDVWVVKRQGKKDVLIPYIPQIVKDVKIAEKKITIEVMEGLLD